jgi:O-antigen ligase
MIARTELPTGVPQVALLGTALLLGLLAGLDPKLAVAAAIGLAFMALVLSDLGIGLALFAGLSFVELVPAGGAPVSFGKLAGLLLAISWLATLASRRDAENDFVSVHPAFTYLLVSFLGWSALSIFWAEQTPDALDGLYRYALGAILFLIVFSAVRERRHVVWVLAAFLTGAVVSAAYGLLAAAPGAAEDFSRLGGAGVDPNQLAGLLVAALAIAAAFAIGLRGSGPARLAAAAIIPFCLLGILFSLSRGGLVALGVALLAAVAFSGRWRPAAIALLVSVGVGAFVYVGYVASPAARERVTRVEGGTGREDIWKVGWRMVEANPGKGVGAGNFDVASIHYLLEPGTIVRDDFIVDTPKVAHNMYLEVLAELGIPGLVMFLGIIGFSLVAILRATRAFRAAGDQRLELLSRALFVALLALLASDFFLSEEYSKQLWLLLALGPALRALSLHPPRPAPVAD